MSKICAIIILAFIGVIPMAHAQEPRCAHAIVFFDVGNTLVDTASKNYDPMFFMTGAFDYLNNLRARGYSMGLISDVPVAWGRDLPQVALIRDPFTAKWVRTLIFMNGQYPPDKTSWIGPRFDPSLFGAFIGNGPTLQYQGRVLLPMSDAEQKKNGSHVLFVRARQLAAEAGCKAIFIGEDLKEITLSRETGLPAFWVGHDSPLNFYPPIEKIDLLAR